MQGTLKERTKVMRGLKTLESMNAFLQGWIIHYNYFRPHLSLQDRTPAQVAGINFPYRNWKELIEKQPYSVTARIPVRNTIPKAPLIKISNPHPRIKPKRTHIQNLGMGIVREHGRQHISLETPKRVALHRARRGVGITRRSDR